MTRCLITNCYAGMGGGEIALLRHLDHSTLAVDQLAVALISDGPLATAVRARGIHCEIVGRRGRDARDPGPGERVQIAWRLIRMVRRDRITHVHCCTVADLLAATIARRVVPFELSWRSQGELTIFSPTVAGDALGRTVVRAVRRTVTIVATTTEWDRRALIEWGVPSSRVATVSLGLDEEWFAPLVPRTGPLQRIVFSGRLVPWKGHRTFLRAFAGVVEEFSTAEAWIVGGGPSEYEKVLLEESRSLGIANRVRFLGHQTDVTSVIRAADVAVHCSEREPFGLVIAEAMASGLPVVASRVEGPTEIVVPGETGYLVAPGDSEGFAAALCSLFRRPERARRMGGAGREMAERKYRATQNVPALERLILQ